MKRRSVREFLALAALAPVISAAAGQTFAQGVPPEPPAPPEGSATPATGENGAPGPTGDGAAAAPAGSPVADGTANVGAEPPMESTAGQGPRLRFSFDAAPWEQVLNYLARESKLPVIREADVPATSVTFISAHEYTLDQATDVLNRMLFMHGLQIRREDNFLMLSKLASLPQFSPKYAGDIPSGLGAMDVVTVVIPLDNASAAVVADQVKALLTPNLGAVNAIPQQNMIVVVDTSAQFRRIKSVVDMLDAQPPADAEYRLFPLKHAKAEVVLGAIKGLVSERVKQIIIDQNGQQRVVEDLQTPGLNIQAYEPTNSIVAVGPAVRLRIIEELIALIDRPAGEEEGREMMTFALASISADEAAKQVNGLFARVQDKNKPTLHPIPSQGKLTAVGSALQLTQIAALLSELDPGTGPTTAQGERTTGLATAERRSVMTRLKHVTPESAMGVIGRLLSPRQLGVVRFAPTPDNKGLIVTGPANETDGFMQLLAAVDVPLESDREVRQVEISWDDPAAVVERVNGLYGLTTRGGTDPVRAVVDGESRVVTLIGSRAGLEAYAEMVDQARGTARVERESRTYKLSRATPSVLAQKLVRLSKAMLSPEDGSEYVPPVCDGLDELGTLVVRAMPSQFAVVEELIKSLDVPGDGDTQLRVIKLTAQDAEGVLARAMELYDKQTAGLPPEVAGPVDARIDAASGTVLMTARGPALDRFGLILEQVQRIAPPARTTRLMEVKQAQAKDILGPLTALLATADSIDPSRKAPEASVRVVEETNSLLVTAEPAQHEMIRLYVERLDRVDRTDLPPLRLLQLKTADAVSIAGMIGQRYAGRPAGERALKPLDVQADAATNTLIVSAHEDLFEEVRGFVEELNRDRASAQRVTELFPLKVAKAVDVAQAMQQLYPEPPIPVDRRGVPMPWARPPREVLVSADPASNSLIIEGPGERMDAFKALAEKLDRVEMPPVAQLRTYRITKADLNAVSSMLRALGRTGTLTKPSDPGKPAVQVTIETEPMSSTLIVAGDEVTFARVEEILRDLEEVPVDRGLRIVPIANADAESVRGRAMAIYEAQVAQLPHTTGVDVTVDADSNSLQVVADTTEMERFMKIMDELQRQTGPARQVRMIELEHVTAGEVIRFLDDMLTSSKPFTSQGGVEPVWEAIEANNSILLAAQPGQFPVIEALVKSLDRRQNSERMPLRILRLRTTDAGNLASILSANYGQRPADRRAKLPVEIRADEATNTLIVAAHPDVLPEIESIVSELNQTQGMDAQGREIRIFPLRVAQADALAKTIDEMFPEPPVPVDARRQPRPDLKPPREVVVRADRGTNSLIVDAPIQRMAGFEQLVKQLDQQVVPEGLELRTYRVQRAELGAVATTLRELADAKALTAGSEAAATVARGSISITTEPVSRSLIVSGPSAIFAEVEKVLAELDAPPDRPTTSLRMYPLAHARAERLQPLLNRLLLARVREEHDVAGSSAVTVESLVDVAADGATNTLIVSAPESVQQITEQLVRVLDTEAAQVGRNTVRVMPLAYAEAGEAARTLNTALPTMELPSGGSVTIMATAGSNALLLSGAKADLDKLDELIKELDTRPIAEDAMDVATFELKHADPKAIAGIVQTLLVEQQQTDPRVIQMQLRLNRGQIPRIPQVKVEADERTNSLIVSGPKAAIELAKVVIERLDQPAGDTGRSAVSFTPKRATAERLVAAVRPVLLATLSPGRRPVELVAEPATGSVVVLGTPEQVAEALKRLSEFDDRAVAAPEVEVAIVDLLHADAGVAASAVQSMLSDRSRWPENLRAAERAGLVIAPPTVNADPASNRVIASAPRPLIGTARELIAMLDRPSVSRSMGVEVFTLTKGEAASVAQALQTGLSAGLLPGELAPTVTPEPVSNAVIVSATPERMEKARSLIASLDGAARPEGLSVRTIALKHARAEAMAPLVEGLLTADDETEMLRDMPWWLRSQYMTPSSGEKAKVRVAAERRLNAVVVTGPRAMLDVAEMVIRDLDVDPAHDTDAGTSRAVRVITLENAGAKELAESIDAVFEDEAATAAGAGVERPLIRVDEASNSLIVRATAEQFDTITGLAGALDRATLASSRELRRIPIDRARADASLMAEAIRRLVSERTGAAVEILTVEDLLRMRDGAGEGESRGTTPPALPPGGMLWERDGFDPDGGLMPNVKWRAVQWLRVVGATAVVGPIKGIEPPDEEGAPAASGGDAASTASADAPDEPVRIAVDPATNSLVVIASPRMADRIAQLAAQLQAQMPVEPRRLRVIALPEGVEADAVSRLVTAAIQQVGRGTADNPGGFTGPVFVQPDPAGGSLIVAANSTDFRVLGELIAAVSRPGASSRLTLKVYPLRNTSGARAARTLTDLLSVSPRGQQAKRLREVTFAHGGAEVVALLDPSLVSVTSSPGDGSLIVSAPGDAMALIDRFVSAIDQSPQANGLAVRQYVMKQAKPTQIAPMIDRVLEGLRQVSAGDGPARASLVGDDRTNTLIVTATADQFAEIDRLIATLDAAAPTDGTELAVIPLRYASPESVRQMVDSVLIGDDEAMRQRVRLTANADANSLVVRASPEHIDQVRSLVAEVDRSGTLGLPIRTIKLEHAEAQNLVTAIQRFFDDRSRIGSRQGRGQSSAVAVVADQRTGTLIVSASDDDFARVESLVKMLDAPAVPSDMKMRVIPLEHARVNEIRRPIESLVDDVRFPPFFWVGFGSQQRTPDRLIVEFDERTNSVIVMGKEDSFATIEGIVASLDVPRPEGARLDVRAVRLANADPRSAGNAIQQALSTPGWSPWRGMDPDGVRVETDAASRTLFVVGRADRLDEAVRFAEQLDAASGATAQKIESISLKFAAADRIATSLQRFFQDRARAAGTGDDRVTVLGSREGNVVVVSASDEQMALVRQLLSQMDQPEEDEGRVREIYHLKNATASEVQTILTQQFPRSQASREGLVIVTAQPATNSVIVSAPPELFAKVDALLAQLDAGPSLEDAKIVTVTLSAARAEDVADSLRGALPENVKIRITPVRRTNSILLTGSDDAIAIVMAQISKLDEQPRKSAVEFRRVRLTNVAAWDISQIVRQFANQLPRSPAEPAPSISVSDSDNSLVVQATADHLEEIAKIVKELDVPTAEARTTEFIPLKFADVEHTAEALEVFYGRFATEARTPAAQNVTIIPNPVAKSLVISAEASEWPGIRALLEQFDNEQYDTSRRLEIIALKHADAGSLARALTEAFQAPLRQQLEQERARQDEQRRGRGGPDAGALPPSVLVNAEDTVTVSAEPLTNSLIVSAGREDMERVRAVVAQIDVAGFAEMPAARLIPVTVGTATQLAGSLREMYSDLESARSNNPRRVVIVGNDRAGTLIVRAEDEEFARIEALAALIQQQADRTKVAVRTIRLASLSAGAVAVTVRSAFTPMAQQRSEPLTVQVDRTANSLVVGSSQPMYDEIRALVAELDAASGLNPAGPNTAPGVIPGMPGRSVFIIDVSNNSPEQVRSILEQMGVTRPVGEDQVGVVSEPVSIVPLVSRRALAVLASPRDAETLVSLVRAVDAEPMAAEQHVVIVRLKTATAQAVATTLEGMLRAAAQDSGSASAKALVEQVRRRRVVMPGADQPDLMLDLAQPVQIMAESQTNSVVIASTGANVSALKEVVGILDSLPIGDAVTVRFFPLEYASAQRIATVINDLFSKGDLLRQSPGSSIRSQPTTEVGKALVGSIAVSVDDRTNSVVVAGREEAVALVEVLIGQLDSDRAASWVEPTVITLQHADATTLAQTLTRVLVAGAADTPEAEALQRQIARYRVLLAGRDPNDPASRIEADRFVPLSSLTLVPEENLNALIVVASQANTAAVVELVKLLDVPLAAADNRVRIYSLRVAAADRIAGILREVFRSQVEAGTLRPEDNLTIATDARTNSLVVSTSPRSFPIVEGLLKQLDEDGSHPMVQLHVLPVKGADATELAPKIERLMRERIESVQQAGAVRSPADTFSIQPEPETNSLIVAASEENLRVVRELLGVLTAGVETLEESEVVDVVTVASRRVEDILTQVQELYVNTENRRRGAESVRVSADTRLNALVVSGRTEDVEAIRGLVAKLDSQEISRVTEIRRIELRQADATDVVRLLQGVLAGRPIAGTGVIGASKAQRLRFLRDRAAEIAEADMGPVTTEAEISGAIQEQVTLSAELRTNSIVVVAPKEIMTLVEEVVLDLDSTTTGGRSIEVFRLTNADAQAMADVLRDLFNLRRQGDTYVLVPGRSNVPGAEEEPIDPNESNMLSGGPLYAVPDERQQLAITIDARTNSLLVSATSEYLERVRQVVNELDSVEATEREHVVYELRNAKAAIVAETLRVYFQDEAGTTRELLGPDRSGSLIRLLEREVTVQGDEASNRLIVGVSPRYREAVDQIVKELDSTPPQVMIQVILAEVTLDAGSTWGMDAKAGPFFGHDFRFGALAGEAGVATSLGVPNLSVSTTDFELLIRALEVQGRLEVLSRPQILVNNNEAARIQVGENIAIVGAVERLDNGNTRSDVVREDVGIILNVTPSISYDDFVRMDILPEISSVTARTTQISEDFSAPIIAKRQVETNVTVRSGETIVIGGLIQTINEHRETKIPLLGDIPFAGSLFRSNEFSDVKTELLVILTPKVIQSDRESERSRKIRTITDEEINRLSNPVPIMKLLPTPQPDAVPAPAATEDPASGINVVTPRGTNGAGKKSAGSDGATPDGSAPAAAPKPATDAPPNRYRGPLAPPRPR